MEYKQEKTKPEKLRIDMKDRKILTELSLNCRVPLSTLSKKIALSRDAISYRIKQYEKRGLIQGYRTIINLSKMGFKNYHLLLNIKGHSKGVEEKFIEKLKELKNVKAIINFGSRFDFEVALAVKDSKELDKIINEINSWFPDLINNLEILEIIDNFCSKALPDSFFKQPNNKKITSKKHKLDKKDILLIKEIAENSKSPLVDISTKLKMSADSVSYRLKNLEDSNHILKYVPVINFKSLGYNLYFLLLNIPTLSDKEESRLKDILNADPNLIWAVKSIGKYNLLAYALVKDVQELRKTGTSLKENFGQKLRDFDILVAFEEYKYTYLPKKLLD